MSPITQIETAREIGRRFGLKRSNTWLRGTCPRCGYESALAVTDGRHGVIAYCFNGCTAADLRACLGTGERKDPIRGAMRQPEQRENRLRRALMLWNGSADAVGTPADTYLTLARGLDGLAKSTALRYRADTPHPETRSRLAAMIALVKDVHGNPLGIHRTFIRGDGLGKAGVVPAKATLGPIWGGSIWLDPIAPEMTIAEGVETAASAGLIFHLPALAGISAGNIEKELTLPAEVRGILIAADHGTAGERAAKRAAARWTAEGRRVKIAWPQRADQDFNDLLRARRAGGR